MYTLLIVEDEEEIREGIKNCILQEVSNFVVKTAKNGIIALDIITKEKIDAMILDIRMPIMDGVSLLKELDRQKISLITVVLSGHDEFEYAKTALEYGTFKYLLKPVTPKEIIDLTAEIKKILDEKSIREFEVLHLKEQIKQNFHLIKERFFNDLILGKVNDEVFNSKAGFFNLKFKTRTFQITLMDIPGIESFLNIEEYEMIKQHVDNILSYTSEINDDFNTFFITSEQIALLFGDRYNSKNEDILVRLSSLKQEIENSASIAITFGVGRIYQGIDGIRKSYIEALNSIKHKLIMGDGSIICYWDISSENEIPQVSFDIEEFKLNLRLCMEDEIIKTIDTAFNELVAFGRKARYDSIYSYCNLVIASVSSVLSETGKLLGDVFPEYANPYTEIYRFNKINDIQKWINSLIEKSLSHIKVSRNGKLMSAIEMAQKIIIENFQEDITTKYIADRLFMNQDYLGRIFKSETGMTLSDYTNKIRINKAMELLKNPKYMVYEVAHLVGFNDQHYFSTVFKKITGLSPSQYKEV